MFDCLQTRPRCVNMATSAADMGAVVLPKHHVSTQHRLAQRNEEGLGLYYEYNSICRVHPCTSRTLEQNLPQNCPPFSAKITLKLWKIHPCKMCRIFERLHTVEYGSVFVYEYRVEIVALRLVHQRRSCNRRNPRRRYRAPRRDPVTQGLFFWEACFTVAASNVPVQVRGPYVASESAGMRKWAEVLPVGFFFTGRYEKIPRFSSLFRVLQVEGILAVGFRCMKGGEGGAR